MSTLQFTRLPIIQLTELKPGDLFTITQGAMHGHTEDKSYQGDVLEYLHAEGQFLLFKNRSDPLQPSAHRKLNLAAGYQLAHLTDAYCHILAGIATTPIPTPTVTENVPQQK